MKYEEKKWKPPYWLYVLLILAGIYLALAAASAYTPGDNIYKLLPKFSKVLSDPLHIDAAAALKNTKAFLTALLFTELAVFIYIMYDATKIRDFMPGKEYGTAQWATPAEICKKFAKTEKTEGARRKEFTHENRVYSEGVRIYMDGDVTRINNNVFVVGGSGTGKSKFLLTPNIYQADTKSKFPGSYIFTDPKGELLLQNGAYLKSKGYLIKVLNLVPGKMGESDRFNPFPYIRTEADITKLITNLQKNTNTGKNAGSPDPFWDKAEALYLKSLFLLVWMEHERFDLEMNMNSVIKLMHECEITERNSETGLGKSALDKKFIRIKDETEPGEEHPAYIAYKEAMGGAEDTVRSIKITADARMAIFDNDEVKRVLSGNDIDLAAIGTGIYGNSTDERTALFCVIPDSDTTYNCVAGMMYTLLFQELYYQADFNYNGKLPVPVTFWLDEFCNIALPDDFLKMLTTMRSRLISCVIIIQSLAQIKAMWEKEWEQIPDNCDVFVYLGGNSQTTFKYLSENMGKKTIHKKSTGEQLGHNRSSSANTDTLGRELMQPEEVRELDNDYCVLFIRGMRPVIDRKFRTFESPEFKKSVELGYYTHSEAREADRTLTVEEISRQEAEAYADSIIEINLDKGIEDSVSMDELMAIAAKNEEEEAEERNNIREFDITGWTLTELLSHPDFSLSAEEMHEVEAGVSDGLTDDEIMSYILYQDAGRMRAQRMVLALMKRRGAV